MNYVKELKGVEGWLAFFIVALCAIGPIMAVSNTFMSLNMLETSTPGASTLEAWQQYKHYTWVVLAISIAPRLIAGFMLAGHFKPISVRFAIGVLWVTPIIATVGTYLVAFIAFGAEAAPDNADATIDMVRGFAVASVWTAYLVKSIRVKNTYYSVVQ